MKRSEAVKRIKQVIDAVGPDRGSLFLANEILRSLEHARFHPPTYQATMTGYHTGETFAGQTLVVNLDGWENE